MTPEQFAYWLQGFVELNRSAPPSQEQWDSIAQHLTTVFVKVTPMVKPRTDNLDSIEDAMRRYREAEQRSPSPYSPNFPYFGTAPAITC